MAKTNNFDELNSLRSDKGQVKEQITKYFEEMELPEQEIEQRIKFAIDLEDAFERLFLIAYAMSKVKKFDKEFLKAYLLRDYIDAMERNGYDNAERAEETSTSVVDTTLEHIGTEYYLSVQRAIECAVTESNAVANQEAFEDALAAGMRYKRWVTMLDNKVRKTHIKVDGTELPIEQPFAVGGYQMMFPMDQSMGAHAKECINCRCSLEYFGKSLKTEENMSIINMDLQLFASSEERLKQYGADWPKASMSEIINKYGFTYIGLSTTGKKKEYVTADGLYSILEDEKGKYFRIHDNRFKSDKGFVDLNLQHIANNYVDEKGKQHGIARSERKRLTHFLNLDKLT